MSWLVETWSIGSLFAGPVLLAACAGVGWRLASTHLEWDTEGLRRVGPITTWRWRWSQIDDPVLIVDRVWGVTVLLAIEETSGPGHISGLVLFRWSSRRSWLEELARDLRLARRQALTAAT
jgi:hypothetical protein